MHDVVDGDSGLAEELVWLELVRVPDLDEEDVEGDGAVAPASVVDGAATQPQLEVLLPDRIQRATHAALGARRRVRDLRARARATPNERERERKREIERDSLIERERGLYSRRLEARARRARACESARAAGGA